MRLLRVLDAVFQLSLGSASQTERDHPTFSSLLSRLRKEETPLRERVAQLDAQAARFFPTGETTGSKSGNQSDGLTSLADDRPQLRSAELSLFNQHSSALLENMDRAQFEGLFECFRSVLRISLESGEDGRENGGENTNRNDNHWASLLEELRLLVVYRRIKKVQKAMGTYLDSKPGRGSVSHFLRSDLSSPSPPRIPGVSVEPGTVSLMNSEFSPCSAVTKRWRSTVHSVPTGADVLDTRASRFGGVRVHYDFSQNEIRVIARIAGDRTLLDAFETGADIHRLVASRVWNKPESEITPTERRYAKALSFGVLYGKTVGAFAEDYLHGNRSEARRVISGFFREFPGVKRWMDAKKREALDTGEVRTVWGDPMEVDLPPEALSLPPEIKDEIVSGKRAGVSRELDTKIASAMRNAANYPIQSISSSIAALSIWHLNQEIRKRKLRALIDCFTHDSTDIDVAKDSLFPLLEILRPHSVDKVREAFQVPVEIETEIGVSGNRMLSLEKIEGSTLTLSGRLRDLSALKERMQARFSLEKLWTERVPLEIMFSPKSSWCRDYGKEVEFARGEMTLPD